MDIIKKLSRSIREYKMVSIMTPVCIVFEVIFEILIPFMMAKMIDSGISSGNESALVKYGTFAYTLRNGRSCIWYPFRRSMCHSFRQAL